MALSNNSIMLKMFLRARIDAIILNSSHPERQPLR
jgi:hypothetical protein